MSPRGHVRPGRRFRVTGRVQGVGFRAFTRGAARELGLDGWVRNVADGSVEAEAGGPAEALAELERRLGQGPPASRVEAVETSELPPEAVPEPGGGFAVRR